LDFGVRFSRIVSARARTKRVHLQAILEFIPKAVRLLLKGFKIPSCFGIKALCGGFLQTAMDPARENDGLSEREKLENEAMKDGCGESETRRWPKDPWSDVTERELKERNNNDAYKKQLREFPSMRELPPL
jgi:hypothetical protein